jgi:ATP-dependent exoDNAse (exonuclease V) alpha subunit
MAFTHNICAITGPAGSGKTTVSAEVIRNARLAGIPYVFTSFTGCACLRGREICGDDDRCPTMHRMLYGDAQGIEFRLMIIDEAGMVYNKLTADILRRYSHKFSIILIGDVNQLQPIAWGGMFRAASSVHRVKSHEGTLDGIVKNSMNIVAAPYGENYLFHSADNFKILNSGPSTIINIVQELRNSNIDVMDIAIICPYREKHGARELNTLCQEIWTGMNPATTDFKKNVWRIGDKLMCGINNRATGLSNGEEGIITGFAENAIIVRFNMFANEVPKDLVNCRIESLGNKRYHKFVTIQLTMSPRKTSSSRADDATDLDITHMKLSYVITAHAAQGKGVPYVIYWLPESAVMKHGFICRPLSYVAITRASMICFLVGATIKIGESIGIKPAYRCDQMCNILKFRLPRLYTDMPKICDKPVYVNTVADDFDAMDMSYDDW